MRFCVKLLMHQELTSLEESSKDFIDGKINLEKINLFHKIVGRFFEMVNAENVVLPVVVPNVLS